MYIVAKTHPHNSRVFMNTNLSNCRNSSIDERIEVND